jgi:hypothetical protein
MNYGLCLAVEYKILSEQNIMIDSCEMVPFGIHLSPARWIIEYPRVISREHFMKEMDLASFLYLSLNK